MAHWPTTVPSVLADYARVSAGERRLADILVGYLDLEDTSIPDVADDIELLPVVAEDGTKVAEIDPAKKLPKAQRKKRTKLKQAQILS